MCAQWLWRAAMRDLVWLCPPQPRTRLTAAWTDWQLLALGLACGMALASVWMMDSAVPIPPVRGLSHLH